MALYLKSAPRRWFSSALAWAISSGLLNSSAPVTDRVLAATAAPFRPMLIPAAATFCRAMAGRAGDEGGGREAHGRRHPADVRNVGRAAGRVARGVGRGVGLDPRHRTEVAATVRQRFGQLLGELRLFRRPGDAADALQRSSA